MIAGLAAIGGGIAFGLRANDREAAADQRCPGRVCDDPIALQENDRAQADARRANFLYAAGGVALAASVILWIAGAPESHVVTVGPSGVAVAGRF